MARAAGSPQAGRELAAKDFWKTVRGLLRARYGHSTRAAISGVDAYKRAHQPIAPRSKQVDGVAETVYNRGEALIAEQVDGVIRGSRPPVPTAKSTSPARKPVRKKPGDQPQ